MDCAETGGEEIWEHSYMNTFYSLICKLRFLMFFFFLFISFESPPSPLNDSVQSEIDERWKDLVTVNSFCFI